MFLCRRHVTRLAPSLSRLLSTCKVAVVGSGPAGFYTTHELLKDTSRDYRVDIIEKARVPFGLVRYGVAPDHPEVKNCISTFEDIASRSNVRFFGNVTVGTDVKIDELRSRYDVVILAHGAGLDKKLGIPGEGSKGCFTAGQFVGWFNGAPEHATLDPDLSSSRVVVIGHGNVALDCARILAAPMSHLETTDIPERALERLRSREVREVAMYGRSGVLQFQGTIKEVREFTKLADVVLSVEADNIEEVRGVLSSVPRAKKRLIQLLLDHATPPQLTPGCTNVAVRFGWSPTEVVTDGSGQVTGVVLNKNQLSGDPARPVTTPTDTFITVPCSTLITGIGYRVARVPGVPFCDVTSLIPELHSRVLETPGGRVVPGLYTSGWARRGAAGVMGVTLTDSANTAASILEDLKEGRVGSRDDVTTSRDDVTTSRDLLEELRGTGVKVVTFEQWREVDKVEKKRGKELGKPREKFLDYEFMVK